MTIIFKLEVKQAVVFSFISVLFVGTIFFSGCTNKSTSLDDIRKKLLKEVSCSEYCESLGKEYSNCVTLSKNALSFCETGAETTYCIYNIEIIDVSEEEITCTDYCLCANKESCSSTIEECAKKCTANGCSD